MKFWIKLGLLTAVAYFACNATCLWQDRKEHHVLVAEVEAVTRAAFQQVQAGSCTSDCMSKLVDAQHRLAVSDQQWERHAYYLGLIGSER